MLEIQVAKLEVVVDMLATILAGMTDQQEIKNEMNLDSGKWYKNSQE